MKQQKPKQATETVEQSENRKNYSSSQSRMQQSLLTPNNNIVDVFEFEPVGFMSKGRW